MSITKTVFKSPANPGKYDDVSFLYRMEATDGSYADIASYGCRVVDLVVPDKDGNMTDVLLGFKDLDGYFADTCFHGAIVGRSANRIAGASCVISGVKCDLPVNDGPHNLHSGTPSFQDQFWDGKTVSAEEADAIIAESGIEGIEAVDSDALLLHYVSPDGATGFPGNLDTYILYAWLSDKTFFMLFKGTSDKDTIFAPTNHSYFNLNGHDSGYVGDHTIQLDADKVSLKDDFNCSDGRSMDVTGTDFDARAGVPLTQLIKSDDPQITMSKGIDSNFELSGYDGTFKKCASLEGDKSGIKMEVLTDLPGIQIYAANFLGGDLGKSDKPYNPNYAVCMEAQMFPNAVNIPEFLSPVIKANVTAYHATGYRFVKN